MARSASFVEHFLSRFALTRKSRLAARDAASIPPDLSDDDRGIVTAVRPYTMTTPERVIALLDAVRHVTRNAIPGAIVECGVWRGGSMMATAMALLAEGDNSRDLYLYDTFEGMPDPTQKDAWLDGTPASELLSKASQKSKIWARAPIDGVRERLIETGYPEERIHLVEGKVEDTIPGVCPERVALLRLDTDWYESTRHELEHLYPRLVDGGILILDDYGRWKGSRQATDEYFAAAKNKPLLQRVDFECRLAVKTSAAS